MNIREYTDQDYETFKQWSSAHGVEVLDRCRYRVGIIAVGDDGEDKAMAFLYLSNAGEGICFLSWLTTNPSNRNLESARACKLVVLALKHLAEVHGYGVMFTQSFDSHLKVWERMGWQANHPVTPMVIGLTPEEC